MASKSNSFPKGHLLKESIYHSFLPKKTPDRSQPDLEHIEQFILHSASQSFSGAIEESEFPELEGITKMMTTWELLQPVSNSPEEEDKFVANFTDLITSVTSATSESTIPIYIRKQNSTLLIHPEEDGTHVVETFRAALPSKMVMSNVSSLIMEFPETSHAIQNMSLLTSKSFATSIYQLTVNQLDISTPMITKKEETYPDLRDVAQPFLINDWIVTVLSPTIGDVDQTPPQLQKPRFCKKISDQVTLASEKGSSSLLPFRRSGIWLSIKVVLQRKIMKIFQHDMVISKLVYKLLMLRYLADICKMYYDKRWIFEGDSDDHLDLAAQMLAKIGRRVHKLEKLSPPENANSNLEGGSTYSEKVENLRKQILERVEDIVREFHQYIAKCQLKISGSELSQTFYKLPARSLAQYLSDLDHSIPFLSESPDHSESSKEVSSLMLDNTTEEMRESLELQRYRNMSDILKGAKVLGQQYNHRERIWLNDTESFMKTQLSFEWDTAKIRELVQTYVGHALKLYSGGNPIGISQMILVTLKAVEALDRKAAEAHPIIKQHTSGINCDTFDYLMLPHKDDIILLEETLNYFRGRNWNACIKAEGVLPRNDPGQDAFSVRFASNNVDMSKLRKTILDETEKNVSKKRSEYREARQQCQVIQTKIEKLKKDRKSGSMTHPQFVERSNTLQYELIFARRFTLFERPLPDEEHLRMAVVFEVLIPEVISHLRDSLAILKFGLLGEPTFVDTDLAVKWMDYDNLINYLPSSSGKVKGRTTVITLGSQYSNAAKYHFRSTSPDVLIHSEYNLIVDNGLHCNYNYSFKDTLFGTQIEPMSNLKAQCSFQINTTNSPEPYLSLQAYLESFAHSQNVVIANQNCCHWGLTFDEFISFGSLRAGHRIQLRNLYRAIASNLLSLEEEPVLALILQTIWQLGPMEVGGVGGRGALSDFKDEGFCSAILDLLEMVVKTNENNYSHPLILMAAVVITARILDLNEGMYENCYMLLRNWRRLVKKWRGTLEKLLGEQSMSNLNELKINMLLVNLCSALSYNVSLSMRWGKIMKGDEDIVEWFQVISALEPEVADDSSAPVGLSGFVQVLLKLGMNVALQLRLEAEVMSNTAVSRPLRQFVSDKWPKAKLCKEPTLGFIFRTHQNLIRLSYMERESPSNKDFVTFDFILGTFLVNGYRQGQLPVDITCGKLFKRFFQRNCHLRVQKESDMVYSTTQPFHGKDYEFRIIPRKMSRDRDSFMDVVIKEMWDDENGSRLTLTLIDHDKFAGIIAPYFVENYTHWYDNRENVYLRKIPTQDSDYVLPHDYQLVKMDGSNNWHFYDEMNHGHLLSIRSKGFTLVSKALERLSKSKDINVVMDPATKLLTAHLPQYNLRFVVKKDGRLECLQYPDSHLLRKVKDSTLVGLRQGVQLKTRYKRVLIIPNGKITCHHATEERPQRCVDIGLGNLGQTSYFVYEFDEVLNRLVPNKSKQAWSYLAALHAVTSQSLPDPYTGLTGTEMAVRILQSGFVWSSSPYDEDCLKILKFIKGLSPKRTYYGHDFLKNSKDAIKTKVGSMESIKWPFGIPSMAAYDGFEIIVDKLIEESQRLEVLYYIERKDEDNNTKPRKNEEDKPTSDRLRLRSYFRHLGSYNQAVAVEQKYFRLSLLETNLDTVTFGGYMTEGQGFKLEAVAHLSAIRRFSSPVSPKSFKKNSLRPYLFVDYEPPQPNSIDLVTDIFSLEFKPSWFILYDIVMSRNKTEDDKHLITLILSAMAYQDAPMEQLLNLHFISESSNQIDFPIPPEDFPVDQTDCAKKKTALVNPSDSAVESGFKNIILRNMDLEEVKLVKGISKKKIYREAKEISKIIRSKNYLSYADIPKTDENEIKSLLARKLPLKCDEVLAQINILLHQWYWTAKLKTFVDDVQDKLNQIRDSISVINGDSPDTDINKIGTRNSCCLKVSRAVPESQEIPMYMSQFDAEVLSEMGKYFRTGRVFPKTELCGEGLDAAMKSVPEKLKTCLKKVDDIKRSLLRMLNSSATGNIVGFTSIQPRLDPTGLLRFVLKTPAKNDWVTIVYAGALGVLWSHIKRLNRCMAYHGSGQVAELERELANEGYANWKPKSYPEWLLLQLELDLMIRPMQVTVAKQMTRMPNRGNGVMQLNMGEGKTSVIVPMLCSVLGNEDSLCRVTVLSSMFNMNHRLLSFAIGGLLNRRVYTIPCKRDMDIDLSCTDVIQKVYEECLEMKGVVITQPEYRLSFRLLAYDKILRTEIPLGLKLLKTENWLWKYARDVLDESDELFNVKYQLVYTVGGQLQLDGGNQRWVICQRLLEIVQQICVKFAQQNVVAAVEINLEEHESNRHQFTPIRLLDSNLYHLFASIVAERVLAEDPNLRVTREEAVKLTMFLIEEKVDDTDLDAALNVVKEDPAVLNKILILSGYLRRGILTLGLSKRWRVDYGVNVSKADQQMAVPFRAKDVPAERAEFGHPDLAILLTHLSYYYSGLSEAEFGEVLNVLRMKQGPDEIYGSWIKPIKPASRVKDGFLTFRGLHLKDSNNRFELFELLRKSKLVIDFWLSNKVFPREAKQFNSKIVMASWDLCYERGIHPVTGFSGTNDSSVLLPLQISQQDLAALQATNINVESDLLHSENKGHRKLEMGVDCQGILEQMKEDRLTVLIDAGALMLDCDNEQVAHLWLENDPEVEAVLYFNSGNELMVKRRSGRQQQSRNRDVLFELSSYQGRLDKCGVFLDDQHCRGTDLKFPVGSRACVTVGGMMKRDKLIQACMRMRKLGRGHWVTFYLSHEACDKVKRIRAAEGEEIEIVTEDVLEWTRRNTDDFNKDGLLYWALAGKNYAQKLAAEDNFYFLQSCQDWGELDSGKEEFGPKATILGSQCVDDEVTKLIDFYGQHGRVDLLVNVIPSWFNSAMNKLKRKNNNSELSESIRENFERIRDQVVERCRTYAPEKTHFSGVLMDEEQERELEPEKEAFEEKIIERRKQIKAADNVLHANTINVVVHGQPIGIMDGIMRLFDMFQGTTFWTEVQPEGWGNEVFATMDFITVINDINEHTDTFLRPIEWVAKSEAGERLLVLSPFEVNELMRLSLQSWACPIRMFSLKRSERQDLLLNERRLIFPRGLTSRMMPIPEDCRSMAALLLASGNLYFKITEDQKEQKAFAKFLSMAPLPWSETEKEAFENQLITKTGFMLPQYRVGAVGGSQGFSADPSGLVRLILKCRHPLLSDKAHVVKFLDEKRYVTLDK